MDASTTFAVLIQCVTGSLGGINAFFLAEFEDRFQLREFSFAPGSDATMRAAAPLSTSEYQPSRHRRLRLSGIAIDN